MTRLPGWLSAAVLLTCCGCGRYADFTLPLAPGGEAITFRMESRPGPVLSPGEGWESHDVLNPSVVVFRSQYLNLYSGFDGRTWHTGLASSENGVDWRKAGRILSPDAKTWEGSYMAANGTAVADGQGIWYWYVAGPEERPMLGRAHSADGRVWEKEARPVLEPGPFESWDEMGVADPYVLRIGPYFYLYYLGQDRARRQRLGLARSTDGVTWQKLRSNPILELGGAGAFDEAGLGEPAVWNSHGFYWMLYTGRALGETRRLGLARSTDGVHWQKQPPVFSGTEPWDSQVVCDPTVLVDGSGIRVWFGGGDVASQDANLHGQIGYSVLRAVPGAGQSDARPQ